MEGGGLEEERNRSGGDSKKARVKMEKSNEGMARDGGDTMCLGKWTISFKF